MPSHPVIISTYNPDWPELAQQELDRLGQLLGSNLVAGEHIGSTALPGLAAKPVLDLMPVVHSLEALDRHRSAIEALGYEWYGEHGLPQRRFCARTDANGNRLSNVHFFASTSPDIRRHLAFRDYLRAHPAIADAYQVEKRRAADLHPLDSLAYNLEKADWVREHEADALNWYTKKQ
ncbi:GrpB family protein [Spirosoma sp. HMF3257]|uniref:GrpB family protein n=1 Tax=Spirosoma telluris TaxID=2183553 RepID=A0A327NS84_9BACT|nr:GrpB family protein [Spirosoma telluris]RAI78122.1 GrpB family protein [Spirosoma telluris]